jgi:predicted acylesterase/phospholipase RssA
MCVLCHIYIYMCIYKLAFFNELRHAYGRTAFMMSGGASLGYYHVGLIGALLDQGLLPRVISGSRCGVCVCCVYVLNACSSLHCL